MTKNMNILITTGIYPPKIGGPAQYAKNLKETFEKMGHNVSVRTFLFENYLPSGLRHIFFFFKIIPVFIKADVVFTLDTYSAGFPTVFSSKIFFKKCVIRTGGDFLWEQYVERTGKKVLLRNFYEQEKSNFLLKEKIIFIVTKWTLLNASKVIFSTEWQRDIFIKAYGLEKEKTSIVENYYGPKEGDLEPKSKFFVASSRNLKWKNIEILKNIFNKIKSQHPNIELFTDNVPFPEFMEKIKNCYAVIQVSLGDISPNLILDAIRHNRPFICTREIGILPRIKDVGIFIDPTNEKEIEQAVLDILDKSNYEKAREKVRQFSFIHTWNNIAEEFINVYKNL